MKVARSTCLAITVFLATFSCQLVFAVDLEIEDVKGNQITLSNPRIDYTSYSLIYTKDFEYSGIRAREGEATITISWSRIKEVVIEDSQRYALYVDVALKNGKTVDVLLVKDSKQGLVGKTELGEFSIRLAKIHLIRVKDKAETNQDSSEDTSRRKRLQKVIFKGLKVTDENGNVTEITKPKIDYTSYGFIYTTDFERNGIRTHLGAGILEIPWKKIVSIQILFKPEEKPNSRLQALVILDGYEKKNLTLVLDSKEGLSGEIDLGEFSIRLSKVRNIVTMREVKSD